MSHQQVWAKVNVPVDEGVADLVAELSAFPGLQTIESCQRTPTQGAWVCFHYGAHWEHPWRDLATFVFDYLGPFLAQEIGDLANVTLRVTGCGGVQGELAVRLGGLERTIRALRQLRREKAALALESESPDIGLTSPEG